jgi:hypothetical protein
MLGIGINFIISHNICDSMLHSEHCCQCVPFVRSFILESWCTFSLHAFLIRSFWYKGDTASRGVKDRASGSNTELSPMTMSAKPLVSPTQRTAPRPSLKTKWATFVSVPQLYTPPKKNCSPKSGSFLARIFLFGTFKWAKTACFEIGNS